MFCHLVGQQSAFDEFPYQTSGNSIASNYPKTITSDFIYSKPPSTMCYLLMTPLYYQSGDVAIFVK